jgi:hypothetical protein
MARKYNYEKMLEDFLDYTIKEHVLQFNYIDVKSKLNVSISTAYKIIDIIILNGLGTRKYGSVRINVDNVMNWLLQRKTNIKNKNLH